NLNTVPILMQQQSYITSHAFIYFAELNTSWMVRVGTCFRDGQTGIGFRSNGGTNWFQASPPGSPSGGSVAAGADGNRFVWAPEGTPVLAIQGLGNSFTQASGVPTGAKVAADRVNPDRFYALSRGTGYVRSE